MRLTCFLSLRSQNSGPPGSLFCLIHNLQTPPRIIQRAAFTVRGKLPLQRKKCLLCCLSARHTHASCSLFNVRPRANDPRRQNSMKLLAYAALGLLAVSASGVLASGADATSPAAQYTLSKGNQRRPHGSKGGAAPNTATHKSSSTYNLSFSSLNGLKLAGCDKSKSAQQTQVTKSTAQPTAHNGTTKVILEKSPAAAMPLTPTPTHKATPAPAAADDNSDSIKQTAVTPPATKKTLGETDVAGYDIATPSPAPAESDSTDAAFDPKQSV